jgi:pertussis toxin subunit 1
MFKPLCIACLALTLISSARAAITPTRVVYRFDSRTPDEIHSIGAMLPWRMPMALGADIDLTHHVAGDSIGEGTSAFVATAGDLAGAIHQAANSASVGDGSYDPEFSTYLYVIRPGSNFYQVSGSLRHAISVSDGDAERTHALQALQSYMDTGTNEWVALGGFPQDRIIQYAELTGAMLNQFGPDQMSRDDFWNLRWVANAAYDRSLDGEGGSIVPYDSRHIATPTGVEFVLQRNGSLTATPLAFSCEAGPSSPRHAMSTVRGLVADLNACLRSGEVSVRKRFYDRGLLSVLIVD